MATLSIHFDPAVIARLTSASGDDTIHVTLTLGGASTTEAAAPVIPHGPLAALMQAGLRSRTRSSPSTSAAPTGRAALL
ncbi:hypothetical protein [Streptomyces incanus]